MHLIYTSPTSQQVQLMAEISLVCDTPRRMGDEMKNPASLMSLLLLVLISLRYCCSFVSKIPQGILRVLFLFPLYYLFFLLPWYFSSATIRGVLSYFITWIGSFKLLLFCFNRGPLSNPQTTFIDFTLISIFPLKIKETAPTPLSPPSRSGFSRVFQSGDVLARIWKRYEVEPLFNQPYFATSLRDFWGRRWNLLSSNILRLAVYDPTREKLMVLAGVGPAKVVATITTFVVSGVMHEIMFYYITCGMKPSMEVTCFFVLHGFCMILEGIFRKHLFPTKNQSPAKVRTANLMTVGFVLVTAYWLLVLPVSRKGQDKCNIG